MLARASSDAGTRLRRSKSASTDYRHHPPILESLDLDAGQQALAAATTAFNRAQGQAAVDRQSKRSCDMSRAKSNASRKSLTSQGSHFPPRESSFRSLKPQSTGYDASICREYRTATMATEQFPPFYPTPTDHRPQSASRPLSSQTSISFSEKARPRSQSKSHQQSVLSSVTSQQIRKARSMYYASSVQTGSPIARPPAKYLTTPPQVNSIPLDPIPALSSMQTGGLLPLARPRIPITVDPDETLDSVRDKYLQNFQSKSVTHKPSMFLAPFKKRQDKARRATHGTDFISANNQKTPDDHIPDTTSADVNPRIEPKEKRSFSGSLKSRFKKVFRRTSNRSRNLPVQQIQASRNYFDSSHLQSPSTDDVPDIPSPTEGMVQRVRSRTPSYEALRSAVLRSGSRTSSNNSSRSNRSLHSESNATHISGSRVTSWGTNSTTENLTQRAIKRLTVIHEAKDSIGSETDRVASLMPRGNSLPSPGLPSFHEPMPMVSLPEESSTSIDPKRVFSALMREIDASKSSQPPRDPKDRTPGAESDVFESSATKELQNIAREIRSSPSRDLRPSMSSDHHPSLRRPTSAATQSFQSKTSTIRSLGRAIRSTIRTVTPSDQRSSPYPEQAGPVCNLIPTPECNMDASSIVAERTQDIGDLFGMSNDDGAMMASHVHSESNYPIRTYTPSASQIEQRVEKAKSRWKTPLEEAETATFPRETNRTYNVANFKLQTGSRFTESDAPTQSEELSTVKHSCDHDTPKPVAVVSPMSPSVYSRDTDGVSILPNESLMSLGASNSLERFHNGGSAVILASQSVRSYVIGTPSPRRPDSTRTSRDWKAWLSHEISSMESNSQEDLTIHENFTTSTERNHNTLACTAHTAPEGDKTVNLAQSCNIARADSGSGSETADNISHSKLPADGYNSSKLLASSQNGPSVLERTKSHLGTSKPSLDQPATDHIQEHSEGSHARPGLSPLIGRPHVLSTPSCHSRSSQQSAETAQLSLMNERFPIIETGRSSSSNSARSSRFSKSPPDSVTSRKSDRSSKAMLSPRVYSDISAPESGSNRNSQRLSNGTLKRSDALHKRKENTTPHFLHANSKNYVSPLANASRMNSLQPLSSTDIDQNTSSHGHYMSNIPDVKQIEKNWSPGASPPRPRIHATLRPLSTQGYSRRPKSAFDLRSPLKYGKTNTRITTISPPRPASELLRSESQTGASGFQRTHIASMDERIVNTGFELEHNVSITPGQQMANHFLKQRKSTSALESGKMRGGMKLVREDTPAFL